jgi:hypothetical protein
VRALKQNNRWQRPYSLVGVAGTNIDEQLRWLREICPPELASILPSLRLQQGASENNFEVGYGGIEADLLYCFIGSTRLGVPGQDVGSGRVGLM